MPRLMIVGGHRLLGRVKVSGSKNASLPVLAAALLCPGRCVIADVPELSDIAVMCQALTCLGARVQRAGGQVEVDASCVNTLELNDELTRRMRASNLVLGPLLARFGRAVVAYPGGCNIGSRPMNLHLKGLKMLGAEISERYGYIYATAERLVGAEIILDMPSVGATENLIMAAVHAAGVTVIKNAAREPEIVDLQNFLNAMGARVRGAGTDVIKIEGVERLEPARHTVIPDRIEAGTHMIAAAITRGDVCITNVIPEHVESLTAKLREAGVQVESGDDWIRVVAGGRPRAVDVRTLYYPGFPTDLQPQFMALMALAEGTSIISETIFENRFKHVSELRRMGADINLEGHTAIIKGVPRLSGAVVEASDLRAGAALVLAALAAENGSIIENVEHIDRGYEKLERKYNTLGARIMRVHS
ncbi:UDP-N-acetylglucosamine 1-carboxyvinyltransferase [Desulfurispora thermophila]|uniref:UDP-N-acetylglucosamine 1-carboxyvinyltransferase n=1 Tax=Desulfurispora thermophila TaxID=265470 RepID=UPI000379762B|nr:UDP-N-acetylglucosamine 1-carboxyvinyltransferase [Desulfurispora thermophila]